MKSAFNPKDIRQWLAVGLGSGLAPKAPGTFGTLAAIPVYMLVVLNFDLEGLWLFVLLGSALGIYLCHATAKAWQVHDSPSIVWDEWMGFCLAMSCVPFEWRWVILGFVLFRFLDIVKPWPISWVDRHVHGGLGIMLDDLLAGFFTAIILKILVTFWRQPLFYL